MKYIIALMMVFLGFYSFSYGIYQWKMEKNKLGAFGTFLLSIVGTILPIVIFLMRG